MKDNFFSALDTFWQINVVEYVQMLQENPLRVVSLVIDLTIVIFLLYKLIKMTIQCTKSKLKLYADSQFH